MAKSSIVASEATQVLEHGCPAIDILPPELLDLIFDNVRLIDARKRALQYCSFVCRRWRHCSLKHIFHTVSFYVTRDGEHRSRKPQNYVDEFIRSDIFPMVRQAVQYLTLQVARDCGEVSITPEFLDYPSQFPALQQLTLYGNLSQRIPPIIRDPASIPSLSCLQIYSTRSEVRQPFSVPALCDVLYLFRASLRRLALRIAVCAERDVPANWDEWPAFPELHTLILRETQIRPALHKLCETSPFLRHARRVDLIDGPGADAQRKVAFVASVAPDIQHLSCRIHLAHDAEPLHDRSISLAAFKHLRSLTFDITIACDRRTSTSKFEPWSRTGYTLATLDPGVRLESIVLRLIPSGHAWQRGLDTPRDMLKSLAKHARRVEKVDAALSKRVWKGTLQHVYVAMYTMSPEVGLGSWCRHPNTEVLENAFPKLNRLGALHL